MANNLGTLVTDTVRPFSDQDTFPVAYSNEIQGGLKSVATLNDRNIIPAERLQQGTIVFVAETGFFYKYINTSWIQLSKSDIQLDQVDNTSDLNKPISIATKTALDQKVSYIEYVNGSKALGPYNASTNSPTLTATPDPALYDGDYYDITSGGPISFSGINFNAGTNFNKGDRLKKKGNQWYLVPLEFESFYSIISQTYFTDTKPSVISAGSVLTTPTSLTCYIAPAGTYTLPSGNVTLSGNLNLIFWDFNNGWTYISFDVAVKDNTVTTAKIADGAIGPSKTTFVLEIEGSVFRLVDADGNVVFESNPFTSIFKNLSVDLLDIQDIKLQRSESGELTITDSNGNYIFRLSILNGIEAKKINTEQVTIGDITLSETNFARLLLSDSNGNYLFKLSDTGIESNSEIINSSQIFLQKIAVLFYGQSNSEGEGLIESPDFTEYSSAKMFKSGIRAIEGTTRENFSNIKNTTREYPSISFSNFIKNLKEGNSSELELFVSQCGQGGMSVQQLSKGSTYYTRLSVAITNAKSIAGLSSQNLIIPAICYNQGESNISDTQANFKSYTNQLIVDVNNDLTAITKQNQNIVFLSVQTSHCTSQATAETVAIWQKELMLENNNYVISCPSHFLEYDIEGTQAIHYSEASRRIVGAYQAKAFFQTYIQKRKFQPLRILSTQKSGNTLIVLYDRNIRVDSTESGFIAVDSSLNAISITAVRCIANRIELDFVDISQVSKLRYARTYTPFEPTSSTKAKLGYGLRGTVRDFEGEYYQFNGFKLDNYALAEIISI